MVKQKTILFDCGGTLVQLDPPAEKIAADFLREEGINITIADVKLAYRIVNSYLKQSSLNLRSPKEKQDFLIRYNMELFKILGLSSNGESWAKRLFQRFSKYKRWGLFPDTTSALMSLKEHGFSLGIVANWDSGLPNLLKQLNIDYLFALVISSTKVGVEKPSPEIFHLAMEGIGTHANESYYVGDEYEVDVIGARSAGIEPILIDRDNILPFADCLSFTGLSQMAAYLMSTQGGD